MGRRFAYRSSALRNLTFALTNPVPTGVITGPLRAILVRLIESNRSCGSGSPNLDSASAPTTNDSHSASMPAARRTETVAPVTSGPMPSPGISVILCFIELPPHNQDPRPHHKFLIIYERLIAAQPARSGQRASRLR